jgi:hypothetical protein
MQELQLEKARLNLELVKTEDKIKSNYHHILSAFSLKNIFSTVTELTSASSLVSKAFTLGKNWFDKRKKKKKQKQQAEAKVAQDIQKADEPVSSE